jgi:hypothetical protein
MNSGTGCDLGLRCMQTLLGKYWWQHPALELCLSDVSLCTNTLAVMKVDWCPPATCTVNITVCQTPEKYMT